MRWTCNILHLQTLPCHRIIQLRCSGSFDLVSITCVVPLALTVSTKGTCGSSRALLSTYEGLFLQKSQEQRHETVTTRHQRLHDGLEVVRANLVEQTTHSSLKLLAAGC